LAGSNEMVPAMMIMGGDITQVAGVRADRVARQRGR